MRPEQMPAAARIGAITYGVKPNEDQVILMNGPMYHSAPHSYGMLAFRNGCSIVLEPRFDPEDLLQLIERPLVVLPVLTLTAMRPAGLETEPIQVIEYAIIILGAHTGDINVFKAQQKTAPTHMSLLPGHQGGIGMTPV
jgi:hypothetical protein